MTNEEVLELIGKDESINDVVEKFVKVELKNAPNIIEAVKIKARLTSDAVTYFTGRNQLRKELREKLKN